MKNKDYTINIVFGFIGGVIFYLLLIILLSGCSKPSKDDCDCYKRTFKTYVVTVIVDGVREERWGKDIISYEPIKCKDEVKAKSIGNDLYIDIECY